MTAINDEKVVELETAVGKDNSVSIGEQQNEAHGYTPEEERAVIRKIDLNILRRSVN